MLDIFTTALAETAEGADAGLNAAGGMVSSLIMIAIMIAVMYFAMIRPQRKKEKAVKNMLDSLQPGNRITTIGGLHATIESIKDEDIYITLGHDQNRVCIARWAVRSVEDAPLENDAEPEI